MELEFDNRTVKQGSFSLELDQSAGADFAPKRGLLSLRYTYPGSGEPMTYDAKTGGFDPVGLLSMRLTFEADGFVTGRIFAADVFQSIELASVGSMFTIIDAASDNGMSDCGWGYGTKCSGATGYIQRVGEVPEPASVALMALGGASLLSARRRKSTR